MKKYNKYKTPKEKSTFKIMLENSSLINFLTSVGLFVGGLLFLLYYTYIGFIPKLENLADFSYMIFTMTIVGTVSFLVYTLLLVLPGLYYNKIFDSGQKRIINTEFFILSITVMPIVIFLYILEELYFKTLYPVCTMLIFVLTVGGLFLKISSTEKRIENGVMLLLLVVIGAFPFLLFTAILLSGQSSINTTSGTFFGFVVYSFVAITVNGFIVDKKQKLRDIFTIAVLALLFLMISLKAYAIIPSFIMHNFHLGDFMAKSINAKGRSCQILLDANTSDLIKISTIDKERQTCTIKGKICVLSNIGTHMLWKIEENITIKLPTEDFSGMIRDTSDKTTRCVTYNFEKNKSK